MIDGLNVLHSHSGIEKYLNMPKSTVLVDECFLGEFTGIEHMIERLRYNGKTYLKVPTIIFVTKGGRFKPFEE